MSKETQTLLFGIGNITENRFTGSFFVSHNEAMLDTADISWPLLLMRIGLVGTIIYIMFTIVFLINCLNKKNIVLFIYVALQLLILSFSSTVYSKGYFWIFPYIVYILFQKKAVSVSSEEQAKDKMEVPSSCIPN